MRGGGEGRGHKRERMRGEMENRRRCGHRRGVATEG